MESGLFLGCVGCNWVFALVVLGFFKGLKLLGFVDLVIHQWFLRAQLANQTACGFFPTAPEFPKMIARAKEMNLDQ